MLSVVFSVLGSLLPFLLLILLAFGLCVLCDSLPALFLALLILTLLLLFDLAKTEIRALTLEAVLVYRNGAGSPPVTRDCRFLKQQLTSPHGCFSAISSAGRPRRTKALDLAHGRLPEEFQLPADQNQDSDLVGALGLAARVFASGDSQGQTLLVAQNGRTRQFREVEDFASADPEDLIRKLAKEDAIPNLEGVAVKWYYLYDCCDGAPDMTVAERRYVRAFWEGFLYEAGVKALTFCQDLPDLPEEQTQLEIPCQV